jgi:hypothetical protein
MHRWIQHAEKLKRHLDYINLATQICRSNHSSPDFEQNLTEKKESEKNFQNLKLLNYYYIFIFKSIEN